MEYDKLCIYCMNEKDDASAICPHCGKNPSEYASRPYTLPPFTILKGKYLLGAVLGVGGFGITYIAMDLQLERRVAIKEFFLQGSMYRHTSTSTNVAVICTDVYQDKMVAINRGKFADEAKTLAKLDHLPGIVNVYEYFNENNTSYIVLEYLDGMTLKTYVQKNGGHIPYDDVMNKLVPVINSLSILHDNQILHRDISPDNIIIMSDGGMKLFDFGGAKVLNDNEEHSTIVMKKTGYTPTEQYFNRELGPWTDEYAMAATIYYCITGKTPPESISRTKEFDPLQPPSTLGVSLSKKQEVVLLKALSINASDRYHSMQEFKQALLAAEPTQSSKSVKPIKQTIHTIPVDSPKNKKKIQWFLIPACGITIIGMVVFFAMSKPDDSQNISVSSSNNIAENVETPASVSTSVTDVTPSPKTNKESELNQTDKTKKESVATETPKPTKKAEPTEIPVPKITQEPNKTPVPDVTQESAETPVPTVAPELTETPVPTATPEPESQPTPKQEPDFTPTVTPTPTVAPVEDVILVIPTEDLFEDNSAIEEATTQDAAEGTLNLFDDEDVLSEETKERSPHSELFETISSSDKANKTEVESKADKNENGDGITYVKWDNTGLKNHPLAINDANAELKLREILDKPTGDIMLSDLWNKKELILYPIDDDHKIRDIGFLSELQNLQRLIINNNEITDLSPLESLTNLTGVFFNTNNVSDISPLAKLPNLTAVDMSNNPISDLSYLSTMTNLESLHLFCIGLDDENLWFCINYVCDLPKLDKFDIGANAITDFSPLRSMKYIKALSVWDANIDDYTFENLVESIEDLPNLESLSLPNNQISDLSPLMVMRNLKNLNMKNNNIEDVSPLLHMNLSSIDLSDNPLENPEMLNRLDLDDLVL